MSKEPECSICGRSCEKTTKHHLVPVEYKKYLKLHFKYGSINVFLRMVVPNYMNKYHKRIEKKMTTGVIRVCKGCHSALQKLVTNRNLAVRYNSLDKVRRDKNLMEDILRVSEEKNTKIGFRQEKNRSRRRAVHFMKSVLSFQF